MWFKFKDEQAMRQIEGVHPAILFGMSFIIQWFDDRFDGAVLPIFTRFKDEMIVGISKTNIHADGRAGDLSVRNITTEDIDDMLHDLNEKLATRIGAESISDGVHRFVVYEDGKTNGNAPHIHFQVRRESSSGLY
jgi:hypothetical protein